MLPKTPYRNDNGERLYTIEQLQEIRRMAVHDPKLANTARRGARTDEVIRKIRYADEREEETVLYRVRILAKEIDRTPQTIRLMERRKGLPPTPLRSGSQRLYTLGMIQAVKEACLGKRHAWVWAEIYMRVLLAWQELGILGARVVDEEDSCEGTVSGSKGLREGGQEGGADINGSSC